MKIYKIFHFEKIFMQIFFTGLLNFLLWANSNVAQSPASLLGIEANIQLQTPNNHPSTIAADFSGCFDKFTIRFDITNFENPTNGNPPTIITLTMPSFVALTNSQVLPGVI